MIRQLTVSDLSEAAKLGRRFFEEAQLSGDYSEERFVTSWDALLGTKSGVIFGAFKGDELVGGIGGVKYPNPNTGELETQETFWFMAPEFRGGLTAVRLLGAFTNWSREVGAERLRMAALLSLSPEDVHRVYSRMGFKAVEVAYEKAL